MRSRRTDPPLPGTEIVCLVETPGVGSAAVEMHARGIHHGKLYVYGRTLEKKYLLKTLNLDDEGRTWARGWFTEEALALKEKYAEAALAFEAIRALSKPDP